MSSDRPTRGVSDGETSVEADKRAKSAPLAKLYALPPEVWIFAFYLATVLVLTLPLMLHFNSSIYGRPGDNVGVIWFNWWAKNHAAFGGTATYSRMLGFPFGTSIGLPLEPLYYIQTRFLLLFTNAVVAWNIDILLSFFLSGITMYYLVRYLAKDRRVALAGGFAYMIGVYHAYYAMWIGGPLAATQWMPLYILLLLKYIKKPGWKSAVYLAISAVVVASTSIHNGLFMGLFTIAFLVGRFVYLRIAAARVPASLDGTRSRPALNKKTLAMSLAVVLVVLLCVLPFFTLFVTRYNPPGNWPTSPTSEELRAPQYIYYNAASPGEYLLPNSLNPVFGSVAEKFTGANQPDFGNAIYVGWVVVLLSLACAFLWRRRKSKSAEPALEGDASSGVGRSRMETAGSLWGFAVAGAAAFVFSLKPYVMIGSVKIPLPSKLLSIAAPWLRWYSRFAVVVSICLIVIACFGLQRLLALIKGRSVRGFVVGIALALLTAEMILVPPAQNFSFAKIPPVFTAIKKLPKGATFAFYPMKESGPFITSRLMFYQTDFQKPMINGGLANSDAEAMRRTLYNPYDPATPGILRRLGINHMVFFMGMIEGTDAQVQDPKLLPPGLSEIMRFNGKGTFEYGRMYKVTAPPADIVPLYLGEISVPYIGLGGEATRLVDHYGIIKLLNYTKRDKKINFQLPVANPFTRREVVIERTNGEVLWRAVLDEGQAEVAQINGLVVPRDGIDLNIRVMGQSFLLSYQDLTIFGATQAAAEIGDVKIADSP
ncbi:MAG: hypothetical protein ACYC99_08500 [Candidatus Geothermincolia bacterium]